MDSLRSPLWRAASGIVSRLREAGHQAVFAGGCVRDWLLGNPPKDIDIATSANPEEVKALFSRHHAVGESFGVVIVVEDEIPFEVATFRAEAGYSDGRHPDLVEFTDARRDVERRDFTINGLLLDPLSMKVIDYVEGQADLKLGVVRAIGEPADRFEEDHLRMLRAVRFAARFGFTIHPDTLRAIRASAAKVALVSEERIRDELIGIFGGPHPDRGLDLLDETGLLKEVLPEVAAMKGVSQPPQFHPEGDVYVHTRMMLGLMENPSTGLAFGVLLHDVAKPTTQVEEDRIRFPQHEKAGADLTGAICNRLRFSNALKDQIKSLVAGHMRFKDVRMMKRSTLKRFLGQEHLEDHLELHRLDCLASHGDLENYDFCQKMLAELPEESIHPPRLLSGHDLIELGAEPGPLLGQILGQLEEAQLEERVGTREEALALAAELLQRQRDQEEHLQEPAD